MSLTLNYVHYITFFVIFLLFLGGIYNASRQKTSKLKTFMGFTTVLLSITLAIISVFVVDKYTKSVDLFQLKNKRILSVEKIVYTGTVKNTGDFPVGKVVVEIKLVNRGHVTGKLKGGNFYKSTGLFEFLNEGMGIQRDKPQIITKRFVVAKNLKPGKAKAFRVYFDYPAYFSSVADFVKVEAR